VTKWLPFFFVLKYKKEPIEFGFEWYDETKRSQMCLWSKRVTEIAILSSIAQIFSDLQQLYSTQTFLRIWSTQRYMEGESEPNDRQNVTCEALTSKNKFL